MHWQILLALVLGVLVGRTCWSLGYSFDDPAAHTIFWYPGELFLRLLKMIVLPLIIVSIITGVSSLDQSRLSVIGLKTIAYYLSTTFISVILGLVVVNLIRPGSGADLASEALPQLRPQPFDDILMNIVPKNVFGSLAENPPSVLSVIFFCILLGLALAHGGEKSAPVKHLFNSLNDAILRLTLWIMRLAPLGVFSLIAHIVITTGFESFDDLAKYVCTVIIGLAIHGFLILPLLLSILGKRKPISYAKAMTPALLTAFSTSSSSATLPITIQSCKRRAGVDPQVAEFVLPLGATVNMDGTALYEAVAVMFIAQAYGLDMTMSQQFLIALTATMAAIGAAGVPRAGLVTMIIVLESVGLPLTGIGLILAVDSILDMCRTTVNVWGDAVGAAVISSNRGTQQSVETSPTE
jgi:Na+/H+-dicarboxylate symporter